MATSKLSDGIRSALLLYSTMTRMNEPDGDRNHLACPECKSTDLNFLGLHNNMRATGEKRGCSAEVEVVSGSYKWRCTSCDHEFVVTLPNRPVKPSPYLVD